MKIRAPYNLPAEKEDDLRYLIRLEWWNLGFRLSIVVALFLVLGSSQAMKAAWYEDMLALLPPIAFLIAMRFRSRVPDESYPYGYQRATVIAFLCSAVALALLGSYLVLDSAIKLIKAEHPSIGAIELFGETVWMGYLMVAALVYSVIPPFIIGRLQQPAATKVHEKTVFVDAKMSKADWMTGLAGVVGVLGVGLGFWWADAVAGAIIGLDVTKDGFRNVGEAVGDLLDRRPQFTSGSKPEYLSERLEAKLKEQDWIKDVAIRLREEGHVFSGEAFIVPKSDDNLTRRIDEVADFLTDYDWRIYEVVVTPVPSLRAPLKTES
ncbi:cation transporter [Hydrocarboniclastica marina]|uniref:Cation diffusion facilitator family transporter n=1 Tax=Hydrocarboniclastica marina TaxID=2259620 RepID=A0A4P7XK28_9ALTE|nr:cation transporter [Hydrocarboniclastica marina]QCF27536.1 cation diffusion facilitator family transporter [Hydrocarboniclastica marina]